MSGRLVEAESSPHYRAMPTVSDRRRGDLSSDGSVQNTSILHDELASLSAGLNPALAFQNGWLPWAMWPHGERLCRFSGLHDRDETMIFDSLCRIAERQHVPLELRRAVSSARVFRFEFNPHEALPKEYKPDVLAWLMDNLYLPFPCIAVEDRASCVVFWDNSAEGEPPLRGAGHERHFIECCDFDKASIDAFYDGSAERREVIGCGCCAVSMGRISLNVQLSTPNQLSVAGYAEFTLVVQGEEVIFVSDAPSLEAEDIATAALRNAASALQEVMLLNDPETFILESTPLSAIDRKPTKLKPGQIRRIPRTNERATYTILKPHEIRDRMGLPMPVGKRSVAPHERRSHLRTLRSEFFRPATRGKQILIPASWIGPSEAVVGKRRYRVILDH